MLFRSSSQTIEERQEVLNVNTYRDMLSVTWPSLIDPASHLHSDQTSSARERKSRRERWRYIYREGERPGDGDVEKTGRRGTLGGLYSFWSRASRGSQSESVSVTDGVSTWRDTDHASGLHKDADV